MLQSYKTVVILDDKGRLVIPAKVRDMLQLEKKDMLELVLENGVITLSLLAKSNGEWVK